MRTRARRWLRFLVVASTGCTSPDYGGGPSGCESAEVTVAADSGGPVLSSLELEVGVEVIAEGSALRLEDSQIAAVQLSVDGTDWGRFGGEGILTWGDPPEPLQERNGWKLWAQPQARRFTPSLGNHFGGGGPKVAGDWERLLKQQLLPGKHRMKLTHVFLENEAKETLELEPNVERDFMVNTDGQLVDPPEFIVRIDAKELDR